MNSNKPTFDYFAIANAFQAALIGKAMEFHEFIINRWSIKNPLISLPLAMLILDYKSIYSMIVPRIPDVIDTCSKVVSDAKQLMIHKHIPSKKTLIIQSVTENVINHLYSAWDWYLKTHAVNKDHSCSNLKVLK